MADTYSGRVAALEFIGNTASLCQDCAEGECCECCTCQAPRQPGTYMLIRLDDDDARLRAGTISVTYTDEGTPL